MVTGIASRMGSCDTGSGGTCVVGSGLCSVEGLEGSSSLFRVSGSLNLGAFLIAKNKMARSTKASVIPTTMSPIEVALSFDGHC